MYGTSTAVALGLIIKLTRLRKTSTAVALGLIIKLIRLRKTSTAVALNLVVLTRINNMPVDVIKTLLYT
jgi:hypothetical protein